MTEALHAENEVARRIDRGAISLSDLKSRRTPVEWFEGIAVIQELCRHLLESGAGADGASFAPEDVVIDASGRVSAGLHEGSEDDSVVRQVGELLHLILADSAISRAAAARDHAVHVHSTLLCVDRRAFQRARVFRTTRPAWPGPRRVRARSEASGGSGDG